MRKWVLSRGGSRDSTPSTTRGSHFRPNNPEISKSEGELLLLKERKNIILKTHIKKWQKMDFLPVFQKFACGAKILDNR